RLAAGVVAEQQADEQRQERHCRQQEGAKLGHGGPGYRPRVLPGRDTIAAPDLPAGLTWVGAEPESMPSLTAGGPALVHFLEYAQLNSVRTLPYLAAWPAPHREAGLT